MDSNHIASISEPQSSADRENSPLWELILLRALDAAPPPCPARELGEESRMALAEHD